MRKFLISFILIVLGIVLTLTVQAIRAQTDGCYSVSFGLEVRPEAQEILDAQGYLVQNIQLEMQRALDRSYEMNNTCFLGEMGQIYNTEPRIFAVFQAISDDYGVLRIMTEQQYYPAPFPPNSEGWSNSLVSTP